MRAKHPVRQRVAWMYRRYRRPRDLAGRLGVDLAGIQPDINREP
jgi:hypothetical protein